MAVIDQERLFQESEYGQDVLQSIDRETEALAAENRRIEQDLIAKERDLTERRPDMEVEAFRAEADAFDARVDRLRSEQDAKARAVARIQEDAQTEFYSRAAPILSELLQDRGASVLLDRRAVLTAAPGVDITDAAIARVDEALGDDDAEPPGAE